MQSCAWDSCQTKPQYGKKAGGIKASKVSTEAVPYFLCMPWNCCSQHLPCMLLVFLYLWDSKKWGKTWQEYNNFRQAEISKEISNFQKVELLYRLCVWENRSCFWQLVELVLHYGVAQRFSAGTQMARNPAPSLLQLFWVWAGYSVLPTAGITAHGQCMDPAVTREGCNSMQHLFPLPCKL